MSVPAGAADGFQPWLGLLPYSEADQNLFFGRERDTADLLRLVRREVVTVLFGRSGTGKSSLLKAGLFPQLRLEQFLPVWIRLDHSGRTPYGDQVRAEIQTAVASHDIEVEILNEPLADDSDDVWEYLHRVVFWDAKNQPVTPVLVFDQFEELFTLGRSRPEIGAFFEELAAVAENLIPRRIRDRVVSGGAKLPASYNERHYKLIVSLREDYVARLDSLARDMPSVMHNRHALTHMTGTQALDVVTKPGGELVSEGVARKIVRFVASANDVEGLVGQDEGGELGNLAIEPALLSLVCSELNLQRIREKRTSITIEQVRRSSDQILEDFYERSMEGLECSDRGFIEDRLVTASGYRTAVPVEEAVQAGLDDEELERLVVRRLLRKEDRLGTPHVELTHDVLTKVVMRSRGRRKQREEEDARRRQVEKDEAERRIVRERDNLEKQRLRRIRNIVRALMAVIAVTTGLTVLVGVLWFSNQRIKQAQLQERASNSVLITLSELEKNPELALLRSIEATSNLFHDRSPKASAPREIEMALRTVTRESLVRQRYSGHEAAVYSVDYSADGKRLLTGAAKDDPTARIWDVESGREIARLDLKPMPGGKATVSCARFSPDGKRIVTATYRDQGDIYIWDAAPLRAPAKDGAPQVVSQPLLTFTGHQARTTTAIFSPDGTKVASGGEDNLVRIWDPDTGNELLRAPLGSGPIRHTKRVRSVAFSADGARLLSVADDGRAILWDVLKAKSAAGGEALQVFVASETETLHDGALSPSGKLVALVGNDKTLQVWDADSGRKLAARSHPDAPMGVAFIDDSRLVTACNDAAVRFWALGNAGDADVGSADPAALYISTLRLVGVQRGHQGWIRDVAVSPDKRFVATGGNDFAALQWKLPPGGEIAVLGDAEFNIWTADLHLFPKRNAGERDLLVAYAASGKGRLRAVDAYKERQIENWPVPGGSIEHRDGIRSISVSPDGTWLVTSSRDQTAIVWDAATGRPEFQITGHAGPNGGTVYQARFSSDGKRIVTASDEGCARVWNALTGAPELMLVYDRQELGPNAIEDFPKLLASLKAPENEAITAFLLSRRNDGERVKWPDPATGTPPAPEVVVNVLNRIIRDDALAGEPAFGAVVRRPMTIEFAKRATGDNDRRILNRLILEDAFREDLKRARVYDARFSADGSKIVTADFETRTATVWDARRGAKLREFPGRDILIEGHGDNVVSAAFSPDGKRVATACTDGDCRLWDVESGKLLKRIPHHVAVRSVDFSPAEDALLLTAAADGVARLWGLPDGELRSELKGHADTVSEARFSRDGAYIVTASRDGTARVCCTRPWWLFDLATRRVTRKLTDAERAEYQKGAAVGR